MGRAVQNPKDSNRRIVNHYGEALKPEPPDDLYARMSEEMRALGIKFTPPKPDDGSAFTRDEFATKYSITKDMAKRAIAKLMKAGKIKVVMSGASSYYVHME